MIRDFFRNLGVAEGENGVFQKKDAGRGQNVVDEVRGAEKRPGSSRPQRPELTKIGTAQREAFVI